MVCLQLKVYLGYLVAQLLLSLFLFGSQRLSFGFAELLGPVLFSGVVYYLCKHKHKMAANVLVGLVVGLGVLSYMSVLKL